MRGHLVLATLALRLASSATAFATAPDGAAEQVSPAASGPTITIEQAMAMAFDRSPRLRAQTAELQHAEANQLGARTYPFNPILEASRSRRDDGGIPTRDREIAISQEIEVAGQRRKRIAAAAASLAAAQERYHRDRQVFAAEVSGAFVAAIRARDLASLAVFEREIARGLADFGQRRLEAGAGTLVDLNLALAAEGRAERQVELGRADETAARAALAAVIGLSPAELPPLAGILPESLPAAPSLGAIEERALAQRQDLAALRKEIDAATARLKLERALAAPNVVVGLAQGREANAEDLDTVSAGVTIPLFQRNQASIAAARADESGFKATLDVATLAVRSEVVAASSRFEATSRALSVFRETVAGTLDENLELVQKSFASGKLRASEVLVFRREFIDSRRELIEAAADAWLAKIALDLATGDTQVPAPPTQTLPETDR